MAGGAVQEMLSVLSTELYTTDFKFLTIPRVPTEEIQCAMKLKSQRLLVHKYCRSCADKQPNTLEWHTLNL